MLNQESASALATAELALPVLGMSCAACQHHVEAALRATAGVSAARVDLMAHRAMLTYDPAKTQPALIVEAIRSAGYDAVLPRTDQAAGNGSEASAEAQRADERRQSRKAWFMLLAGAFAMLASMPLGMSSGEPMGWADRRLMQLLPALFAVPAALLGWSLLVLTALLLVWAGRPVYASALRALRHGATNMNTLVGLGTSVAFVYSAWATAFPAQGRAVYFDAVLMILGFLLLGKSLEHGARRRALAALDSLTRLRPLTARKLVLQHPMQNVSCEDSLAGDPASESSFAACRESIVPLEEVRVGDLLRVLPGERFPVDAILVEGRTTVDESMLTGESTPLDRQPGGLLLAGSLNYDGSVVCRAQSLGQETVLGQITRMVSQAQSSRAPMERLADRASAIFVPMVLGLALITFAVWIVFAHALTPALAAAVAVLVIACPCAMGLAVPAALTVAVGRAAQLGVLFKGGEALERLTQLDVVVLDKTGTLTVGRPVLSGFHAFGALTELEALRLAASAEAQSNHPLAHALLDRARASGLELPAATAVQSLPGRGLSATVEGHACLLGNRALFAEYFIPLPTLEQAAEKDARGLNGPMSKPGSTELWFALDGEVVALFEARDALREDAPEAIAALHRLGLRTIMLTGDSATAAEPIAHAAGIGELEAALDPAGKLARIRALQAEGLRVAMVGDGINDAAALAQADAGLAMGTGADLAQEAGDVLLMHARPAAIPAALALAGATVRIMRQNLYWAMGYNLLAIPLAAGVFYPAFHLTLSPWLAAAAMATSSVSVLANSLRLSRWTARESGTL